MYICDISTCAQDICMTMSVYAVMHLVSTTNASATFKFKHVRHCFQNIPCVHNVDLCRRCIAAVLVKPHMSDRSLRKMG